MALTSRNMNLMDAIAKNNRKDIVFWAKSSLSEDKTQKNSRQVEYYLKQMEEAEENIYEIPYNLKGMIISEMPEKSFMGERYYSTPNDKKLIDEIFKMHKVGEILSSMAVPYKNTTLLYGPSGTGKTTFSRYIAYKLKMPFIYINFSNVMDSHMGATAKNIANIFDFVKSIDCVFMLDEIDCISIKRANTTSSIDEEMARVTISVMQELDKLGNNHIIIGATNREDRLDEAILRRFSKKYFMNNPTMEDKVNMATQYFSSIDISVLGKNFSIENAVNVVVNKSVSQADVVNNIAEYIADYLMENMDNC